MTPLTARDEFPGFAAVFEGEGEAAFADGDPAAAAVNRRAFLALSAAVAAGAAGCRRPDLEILPFASVPEGQWGAVVPGKATFYATALPRPGGAFPVLVESHEGRPTKVEGNPRHPASGGATDAQAQASILDLYSPDRVMNDVRPGVVGRGRNRRWEDFDAIAPTLLKDGGEGFAVLAARCPAPAVRLIREHLAAKFPRATWHGYEPIDDANALEGARLAFGKPLRVHCDYGKVERILALDCDFLGTDPEAVPNGRDFVTGRPKGRLYAVESTYTVTGTMADHRLRLPASRIGDFLVAAAKALHVPEAAGAAVPADSPGKWIAAVAGDLRERGAGSLIVVGPRQPAWVHALAHLLNDRLGSSKTGALAFRDPPAEAVDGPLAALVADMQAGKVQTLLIVGGDPVHNAPADLNFRAALGKVGTRVRLGAFHDRTSEACDWHLPQAHPFEGWGDTETADGTLCCVQPLIAPLRGGRTALEVLALLTRYVLPGVPNRKLKDKDGRDYATNPETTSHAIAGQKAYDLVRLSFGRRAGVPLTDKTFDAKFDAYKQLGFLPGSARPPEKPALNLEAVGAAVTAHYRPTAAPTRDALEVTFHPDNCLLDGRFAANAWLQELPDPITKLVWDNAAIVSPATAAAFGLTTGDRVELMVRGRTLDVPAFVLPGQADFSVALPFGQYGQMRIAHVPDGGGFDVFLVRDSAAPHVVAGCTLRPTGKRYDLAVTQEHGTIPEGRDIVREVSVSRDPESSKGSAPDENARSNTDALLNGKVTEDDLKKGFQGPYGHPPYRGTPGDKRPRFPLDLARPEVLDSQFQWGMVIDLSACTGCSACMVACQAENNIPVVGKSEVKRNREMHWIRIDRYFTHALAGSATEPQAVSQPVACVHCEAAPCEQVCPVNAAVHSPEGLNLLVYNRCIGTRYCANACPYKVRRFNWFDFNKRNLDELRVPTPLAERGMSLRDPGVPETLRMQKNPDVTVRMRGVMEKCTYCVQRLEAAKYGAKIAAAEVAGGRRAVPTADAVPADGSAYRKPIDPRGAGYDLDADGRVIVPDGFVRTACQQACPTAAIAFGNTRDPASRVSAAKAREGEYLLLGELNTKPRTSYLPRVRNLNPRLSAGRSEGAD